MNAIVGQNLPQSLPQTALARVSKRYVARRNFFNFLGVRCEIRSTDAEPLLFVKMKAFKFKEDITVFADPERTQPLVHIRARKILDFSAAYDVIDANSGHHVGALRRKGWKSLVQDEWEVLDVHDHVVGKLQEDSLALALVRRFLANFIPQNYTLTIGEQPVAQVRGTWNPFIVAHEMDFSKDEAGIIDPRMAISMSVLLMVIEGKQG